MNQTKMNSKETIHPGILRRLHSTTDTAQPRTAVQKTSHADDLAMKPVPVRRFKAKISRGTAKTMGLATGTGSRACRSASICARRSASIRARRSASA
jgi:hypothetical protein